MQLWVARLCLDCEELHDQQQCPRCASESFAYISRWVPSPERRFRTRGEMPAPPAVQKPEKPRKLAYGAAGLALAGVAGWWWSVRKRIETAAESGAGELK